MTSLGWIAVVAGLFFLAELLILLFVAGGTRRPMPRPKDDRSHSR